MKKYIRLILLVAFAGFGTNISTAQTTILDQTLLTQASFNAFTNVSVTGAQIWHGTTSYGAVCSGYNGQSFENEDWLISPAMNLTDTNNVILTFDHTRGNTAAMNAGVAEGWYTAFATSEFTGDPSTTQWIPLEGLNQTLPAAWEFIASGNLVIPDGAKSATSRIAFRYQSSTVQSATWEIKNVKVTGDPEPTSPNAGLFRITNWNTEWLGCATFGPGDDVLQINNVAAAMLSMNSDIYCLQEVTNSVANPSIETLLTLMGVDDWGGAIVPGQTDDCEQRQAMIYKKSKVQFVSAALLSSGSAAQGNSYYYNWSSGRYPALYNVNLISGNNLVPLSLVNIHAKAEDGNAMSYTRRLGGSEALQLILNGPAYNSKNLMVIGDFNDHLNGTTSASCACTASPYQNFVDDTAHYSCITEIYPVIEHIILSDELTDKYVPDSVAQNVSVTQIPYYYSSTSDHLPISAALQFSVLGTPEYASTNRSSWAIYPNPVTAALTFDATGLETDAVTAIYDITGRQMRCDKIDADTVNVSALPAGIYILKAGSKCGKFVKE